MKTSADYRQSQRLLASAGIARSESGVKEDNINKIGGKLATAGQQPAISIA
jgi:hypothetical protein